jgi:hypothetical protein
MTRQGKIITHGAREAEPFIAGEPFAEAELFDRVIITRLPKAYAAGRCCL